jgi:beta-xylosidase
MLRLLTFVLVGLASFSLGAVLPAAPETSLARRVVGPGKVTGATQVHDPTMCKDGAGKYWIFATGVGLPIITSTDRTAWTSAGVVWPSGAPAATNTFTGTSNGALWAPDCQFVNNQFRLFYAASTFGSQKARALAGDVERRD